MVNIFVVYFYSLIVKAHFRINIKVIISEEILFCVFMLCKLPITRNRGGFGATKFAYALEPE